MQCLLALTRELCLGRDRLMRGLCFCRNGLLDGRWGLLALAGRLGASRHRLTRCSCLSKNRVTGSVCLSRVRLLH